MNLISYGAFRHLMLVEIFRNLAISSRTGRNSDHPIQCYQYPVPKGTVWRKAKVFFLIINLLV